MKDFLLWLMILLMSLMDWLLGLVLP